MIDWIEKFIEASEKRIHDGLIIAIAFFLAMALRDELTKEEKP